MKPLLCLLMPLLLCIGTNATAKPPAKKKIHVAVNRTIETIMILRAISPDDYFFSKISAANKKRPLLYEARQYFKNYSTHKAVAETQRVLNETKDIGGTLFQGILYAEELPGTQVKYGQAATFWKEHNGLLAGYMKVLADFYKEAHVADFFKTYERYYTGAIAEAQPYVDNDVVSVMEDYFGRQNESYTLYLMPLCPYGWGFSASVGTRQFAMVAPVGNTEWKSDLKDYKDFGFAGAEAKHHYRDLVTHEYTHSFITNVLEQPAMKQLIQRYDTLLTTALDSNMQEQGYGDWWGFVNEHLVRAGEIRVAALMDAAEANEMLKENVNEYKFIMLPDATELLKRDYETNRKKYKTIDLFLPVMINQLATFNKAQVDDRLKAAS